MIIHLVENEFLEPVHDLVQLLVRNLNHLGNLHHVVVANWKHIVFNGTLNKQLIGSKRTIS